MRLHMAVPLLTSASFALAVPCEAQLVRASAPVAVTEHASGGEAPIALLALGAAAIGIYDIASAPASARWYNQRHAATRLGVLALPSRVVLSTSLALPRLRAPGQRADGARAAQVTSGAKSPGLAAGLSAAATILPVGLGQGLGGEIGGALVVGGLVLGPSVGHWYCERTTRGLLTAGLRAAAGLLAVVLYSCCT